MNDWNYKELVNTISETYNDQILQGLSTLEAIGVTSENFMFFLEEKHEIENLITLIETIFLSLTNLKYVYKTTILKYDEQKKLVSVGKIKSSLSNEEYVLFMTRLAELEIQLVHSEIRNI